MSAAQPPKHLTRLESMGKSFKSAGKSFKKSFKAAGGALAGVGKSFKKLVSFRSAKTHDSWQTQEKRDEVHELVKQMDPQLCEKHPDRKCLRRASGSSKGYRNCRS